MRNIAKKLINKNGLSKEQYVGLVRKGAKEKYPHEADEIALLRKEVALLREVIEKLTGTKLPDTEFVAYNSDIEAVKAKAKAETNL